MDEQVRQAIVYAFAETFINHTGTRLQRDALESFRADLVLRLSNFSIDWAVTLDDEIAAEIRRGGAA